MKWIVIEFFLCSIWLKSTAKNNNIRMDDLFMGLDGIIVTHAEKRISFENSLVKTILKMKYMNSGSRTNNLVYFISDTSYFEHIAVLSYKEGNMPVKSVKKSSFLTLNYVNSKNNVTAYYKLFEIVLHNSIVPGGSVEITFTIFTIGRFKPYPLELPIESKPMYNFFDTVNIVTVYPVSSQKTKFMCNSCKLLSYFPQSSINDINNGVLEYSIENEMAPFENQKFELHFILNEKYTSIKMLHRKVYISEYANVEYVESHTIHNNANKLMGEFSRTKFSSIESKSTHIVNSIRFQLPKDSFGYYYRDMVGNISTSRLFDVRNYRIMDIKPRFPLMGGWNTEFTIKYKRPSQKVIQKDGHSYDASRYFKINLLGACQDIQSINHFILEIILPEYASFKKYDLPLSTDFNISQYKTFYYMDTYGRPTLRIESSNLISNQDATIDISYNFNSIYLLFKPCYCSLLFFILLFTISIVNRSKIFVSYESNQPAKVDELLEFLQDFDCLCKQHLNTLKQLADTIDSYKMDSISKNKYDNIVAKLQKDISIEFHNLNKSFMHLVDIFPDCKVDLDHKVNMLKNDAQLLNKYAELTFNFKNNSISEKDFLTQYEQLDNEIQCNKEIVFQLFD